MKIRRESVQTQSETGTRWREALRHTRAVCRRAERRDCLSQPRIRACSRNFMNNAGKMSGMGENPFWPHMPYSHVMHVVLFSCVPRRVLVAEACG